MSLLHSGSTAVSGEVLAEGVDFDGTYDYLSKPTTYFFGTDSPYITFSAWAYGTTSESTYILHTRDLGDANSWIYAYIANNGNFYAYVYGQSSNVISFFSSAISLNTWHHIVFSLDSTVLNSSKLYIDDILIPSASSASYGNIEYSSIYNTYVGANYSGPNSSKCRLSNMYISKSYIDLSIEANRRLFITADGKPTPTATLKALNPILYLPLKDAATAHINEGTGGNFTPNGTFATSNRGANQDNCVASYFDGTADYLSRTSLTGIADGKQIVVSGTAKSDGTTTITLLELAEASNLRFGALVDIASSGMVQFRVMGYNSSNTLILRGQTGYIIPINSTFSYAFSCDLTDTNKRVMKINGITITPTWTTYTNADINFLQVDEVRIGRDNTTTYGKGNIGELYFDTKYIDLATNNPFWIED